MSPELDYILSPVSIRDRCAQVFSLCKKGETHFQFNENRLEETADYVIQVIRANYPELKIPYHSRWGHFKSKQTNELAKFNESISDMGSMERARVQFDLVIPSVLLDAGAGPHWKYKTKTGESVSRSEGLGIASLDMFMSGIFANSSGQLRSDGESLKNLSTDSLQAGFQISEENPMEGFEGRWQLIRSLGRTILDNEKFFPNQRPGGLVDYIQNQFGPSLDAKDLLQTVLMSLGHIWPGRLSFEGVNVGDVWSYSPLGNGYESFVPLHKLSQWLTYSLIEPLEWANFEIKNLNGLTGLAEYRNGGLMLDSGLLTLRDSELADGEWAPSESLIVEWRALTVSLLDELANLIRLKLKLSDEEFPLAKILEGGTWWAGRRLAQEKRNTSQPPLKILSDGTVF